MVRAVARGESALEMRGSSKLKNLNAEEVDAMRKVCKVRSWAVLVSDPSSFPTAART